MTTHKPKVSRFHCHGHNAPAYSCNRPYDNSGEYVRLKDYEALQAECDTLVEVLELALEYWADRQQRYKNRSPMWVNKARSALATCRKQGGEL